MGKLNPYSHLLIRMTLVLIVVAAAAFLYNTDADVRANETDPAVVATSDVLIPVSDAGAQTSDTEPDNPAAISPEAVADNTLPADTAIPDETRTASEPGDGTETAPNEFDDPDKTTDITDVADNTNNTGDGDTGNPGTDNGNDETTQTGFASDGGTDNGQTENPEGDNDTDGTDNSADDAAAKLAEYKKTQEYVDSLLVTHPDHYNAKVVENARSIPTDSDNDRYLFITGKDKKIYKVGGMPEGFKNDAQTRKHMVTLDVPVWKMTASGDKYSSYWPITINEKLADSIRCIFSDIYQLDIKFPFNYLTGYSFRKVNGVGLVNSKLMSTHAFGVALDINLGDYDNDYFLGKGNDLRNKNNPYCIPDEVIRIFEDYGWFWGGNYDICADTMHFQYFELGFLQYESDEPFPILSRGAEGMDPLVIRNLTQRLVRLGYLEKETSNFSKKVDKAVKQFQEEHGLEPDGVVNYATWEPLINLTHFMKYVF